MAINPNGDAAWFPVDLVATPAGIVVHAELPGVQDDAVRLSIRGKRLTIRAPRGVRLPLERGARWIVRERQTREYRRSIDLPFAVDLADAVIQTLAGLVEVRIESRPPPPPPPPPSTRPLPRPRPRPVPRPSPGGGGAREESDDGGSGSGGNYGGGGPVARGDGWP